MLPAANRLRRSADFTHVLRRGRRAASPTLVVSATPDSDEAAPRIGFVVSKSVGNAVVRNRVKRRLRHAVRTDLPQLRGLSVVVRANPTAADASYARLASDLERCLSRVKD